MKNQDNQSNRSMRHVLITISIIGFTLLALFLSPYLVQILLLIFGAILFAVLLRIPVDWLEERISMHPKLIFVLTLSIIILLAVLTGVLLMPGILSQIVGLSEQLPGLIQQLNNYLPWTEEVISQVLDVNISDIFQGVGGVGSIFERVSGLFSGVMGVFTNFLIFFALGIYLAYEPGVYVDGVIRLFSPNHRQKVRETLGVVVVALKWWLIGRFIAMLILGVLVGIGLVIMDLPFALGLAVVTGLFSFIPLIGGVLAFIPSGLVAFAQGPVTLLYVTLIYLVAQGIENYLLTPIVQRRTVFMAPAVALVIQLLMGIFAGLMGVALAYPIAVVGLVLVKKLYIEEVIGEPVQIVPED